MLRAGPARNVCGIEEHGKDFAAALDAIAADVDLGAFRDILTVAKRHALILGGPG